MSLKWQARKLLYKAGLFDQLDRLRATGNFRAGRPHEEEFRFLARAAARPMLMMDVGANAGQSALSARIFHPTLTIYSYEPNLLMKADLDHTKSLLGGGFQYFMFGLGSENSVQSFYIPYVSGVPLFQEASFDKTVLETDAVTLDRIWGATGERAFEIRESKFELRRMDSLGLAPDIVKIDVQGTEFQVIKGMGKLLDLHPLFMVENGPHLAAVNEHLSNHGYEMYAFDDKSGGLKKADWGQNQLNLFFLNPLNPSTSKFTLPS